MYDDAIVIVTDVETSELIFATDDGTEGARRILVREGFIKADTEIQGYGSSGMVTVREEFGPNWKNVIANMDDDEFNYEFGRMFKLDEVEVL